jgi:hypothetical protein
MINFKKIGRKIFGYPTYEEVDKIIEYYNKRLISEMTERKEIEKELFRKMYLYRDLLIQNGIELPE